MPIKILIADDERLFRQSLKKLLEGVRDLRVVAEAADGQEAVVRAQEKEPDIALLDVRMPKMDGIKAAKLLSSLAPKTKVLMLSIHDDDEKIISALRAGAAGYILKDADQKDFIEIIRHTYQGKALNSPYLAHLTIPRHARSEQVPESERKKEFAEKYGLTEQEVRLLHLLTEGLSNEEMSRIVNLSRETIKMHLKALFRKLQVKNRTEAAVLAVRDALA
ncbi:MAG TPA: response regulator transcription factor [Verrucomicrobiae bacterium]|jgi:two-component system, NarL family, response regulator DegU|nr:response regulator transcription factor [Verrucomicrobiae bacterium]